jgi:RND family efflux transporter MFP subunit
MSRRLLLLAAFSCLAGAARADDAPAVPVAHLAAVQWRQHVELSASLQAQQQAVLGAARPGRVLAVLYQSGQSVPAGTLLVQLDDEVERAQFALDQARLAAAQRTLLRSEKLIKIEGTSEAALEQVQADSAAAQAQLKLDQAALDQLDITAPFAGTLGIRLLSPGDYVQQGQEVANLTGTGPLRVLFSVPQTEADGLAVGEPFSFTAGGVSATGRIIALSPALDPQTSALAVEGSIPAGAFLPGMAGTVTLAIGAPQPAFRVPASALNNSLLGRFIYVVTGGVAHAVYVDELDESGDEAVIAAPGLKAGQNVAAIGGFKLSDGESVTATAP